MKFLLDTHALIWWFLDDASLRRDVHAAIESGENEVLVSPVSAYEMALKHGLGRLPDVAALLDDFMPYLERVAFKVLPITLEHAQAAGALPLDHRDPFDRLLIAQARIEDAVLVSNEKLFDRFDVRRLW